MWRLILKEGLPLDRVDGVVGVKGSESMMAGYLLIVKRQVRA